MKAQKPRRRQKLQRGRKKQRMCDGMGLRQHPANASTPAQAGRYAIALCCRLNPHARSSFLEGFVNPTNREYHKEYHKSRRSGHASKFPIIGRCTARATELLRELRPTQYLLGGRGDYEAAQVSRDSDCRHAACGAAVGRGQRPEETDPVNLLLSCGSVGTPGHRDQHLR